MADNDSTEFAIQTGVGLLIATVFAVITVGMVNGATYDALATFDNDTEWNEGVLASTEVVNTGDAAYVQLAGTNLTGDWVSQTLGLSDADRIVSQVTLSDPDNSSVSLFVGYGDGSSDTVELEDGENVYTLPDGKNVDGITYQFSRDSDSTTSPQVDSGVVEDNTDPLIVTLTGLAFVLLLLGVVLMRYRNYRQL